MIHSPSSGSNPRRSANVGSHFARYSATVLLLGGSAAASRGAIVYWNPADVSLSDGSETRVDFLAGTFGDSPPGLLFRYSSSEYVELHPLSSSVSGVASDGGSGRISRFDLGDVIGSGGGAAGWDSGWSYLDYENEAGYPWNTNTDGTTGYIGIRLNTDGTTPGTYFGWLRVTYDDASNLVSLHDFAYETTANLAISAGAGAVVPEPAQTGILAALGAAGLAAWRRLRKSRPALTGA